MESRSELFLLELEKIFGMEDDIREIESPNGGNPLYVIYYYNRPENGKITSITYGLSEGKHPEWKEAKPEIMVTLESMDENWGIASAKIAAKYRGNSPFSTGEIYSLDKPISSDSEMVGFFISNPSVIEETSISINNETIKLIGMYPLYKEEIDLFKKIGVDKFWELDGYDLYSVKRKILEE